MKSFLVVFVCGNIFCCIHVLFPVPSNRTTFSVDPDTHIDSIEQAEQMTIEGTSKWSCKIAITGIDSCILLGRSLKIYMKLFYSHAEVLTPL